MTKLIRCDAGLHQFDADRYSLCPYCNRDTELEGGVDSNVETRVVNREGSEPAADNKTTRPMKPGANPTPGRSSDEVTRVLRTSGRQPVTGWLVVVEGPGKGAGVPIYHGVNTVGRDRSQKICLDFGGENDPEIARELQSKITYDPKNNRFYLQHGEGSNLTYLNDEPVLELKTLSAYDHIVMGKSRLIFVPFCNDQFQWPSES